MSDGKYRTIPSLSFMLFLLSLVLSFTWLRWQDDCVIGVFILLMVLFSSHRFMVSLSRLFHEQEQNLEFMESARTWLLLALTLFLLARLLMERPFWWQDILSLIPVLFFLIMIISALVRGWKEALGSWHKYDGPNDLAFLSLIVLSSSIFLFLLSPVLLWTISPSALFLEELPYPVFTVPLAAAVGFLSKRGLVGGEFHGVITELKGQKNLFRGTLLLGLYVALFLVGAGTFRTWLEFRHFRQAQHFIATGSEQEAVRKLVRVRDFSKMGSLGQKACEMLGKIFLERDDDVRARENFLMLLKLNPPLGTLRAPPGSEGRSASAHLGLGRLDERRDEFEWAARHYAKALDLRSDFQPAIRALVTVYIHLRDYASLADLAISKAHFEVPDKEARLEVAKILLSKSEPSLALIFLESLPDDFSRKEYYLGRAYLELGRLEDAFAALKSACEREANFADAWFRLGLAQERLGEIEPAKQSFSQAARLLPNHLDALLHLNLLLKTDFRDSSSVIGYSNDE